MKSARTGAMFFAYFTLVGGYFMHQYFWLSGPEGLAQWNERMLPLTIGSGWVLLLLAIAFGFTKPDEDEP
jgi:hypothetical protein